MADRRVRGARTGRTVLALALLIAVVGGVIGGVIAQSIDSPGAPTGAATSAGEAGACSIPEIADRDLRSVVTITATSTSSTSTGSGEVVRSDGYIVTNNHVVQGVAAGGSIEVRFNDGALFPATIVGRDPVTDLAVIKAHVRGAVTPIPLGSSGSVRVGEPVVVLGVPLGLSSTVTSGIVSALDRTVEVPGETSQGALLIDAIQTDAAINPGNSGGALVDCSDRLIGIPSAGATVPTSSGESSGGSIGLGFAIPVDLVKTEVDEIIKSGTVTHSYLGLGAEPLSVDADARSGADEGLLVTSVVPDGPAERAGIRPRDVILTIDGRTASSTDQLVAVTLSRRPGETVQIGYRRGRATPTAKVVLAAQP